MCTQRALFVFIKLKVAGNISCKTKTIWHLLKIFLRAQNTKGPKMNLMETTNLTWYLLCVTSQFSLRPASISVLSSSLNVRTAGGYQGKTVYLNCIGWTRGNGPLINKKSTICICNTYIVCCVHVILQEHGLTKKNSTGGGYRIPSSINDMNMYYVYRYIPYIYNMI